jgi:glucose-1-phosphate cytidylyltransferase
MTKVVLLPVEWERASLILERLATNGQLAAYRHEKFWQCLDTLRDNLQLEWLWARGEAPWRALA